MMCTKIGAHCDPLSADELSAVFGPIQDPVQCTGTNIGSKCQLVCAAHSEFVGENVLTCLRTRAGFLWKGACGFRCLATDEHNVSSALKNRFCFNDQKLRDQPLKNNTRSFQSVQDLSSFKVGSPNIVFSLNFSIAGSHDILQYMLRFAIRACMYTLGHAFMA